MGPHTKSYALTGSSSNVLTDMPCCAVLVSLVSRLNSSGLKLVAVCSSETSLNFYQFTWSHISSVC
jgi:hypothetical protein